MMALQAKKERLEQGLKDCREAINNPLLSEGDKRAARNLEKRILEWIEEIEELMRKGEK